MNTPVKKATQYKKGYKVKKATLPKNVKIHEKNKFVNFPTKIKESGAFFTVRFFYLALLVALFIPYTLCSIKSVPKSVSRKERPTERASRRRSPKKNSDINFFAEKCQIFEKKWQSFAEKERKIPLLLAKIRVFTLKWVFFALKSDFRKIFAQKKRPHHVESIPESVRRASTM